MTVSSEIVFDLLLIRRLDDDLVFSDSNEHVITDTHPGNGQFVLMEVEVSVVILTAFVLCTAWTQLFSANHRFVAIHSSRV